MPVSSQTLFRRTGLSIDLLEIDLVSEGYLFQGETLLEVIKAEANLKRHQFGSEDEADEFSGIGDFPDDWTEEDYMHFHERESRV